MFKDIFRGMYVCVLLLILLFSIYACSSEKQTELTSPPQSNDLNKENKVTTNIGEVAYIFQIKPEDPDKKTIMKLIIQNLDLSSAKVEWQVNGNLYEDSTSYQLNPSQLSKGDNIQAIAIVDGRKYYSNIVRIKNTPPEITDFKITPETLKSGDGLGVEINAKDADGDNISFTYEWTKNGEPAGTAKKIGVPIKRGDKISVKITLFDGESYSQPFIFQSEIGNMPPVIVDDRQFNFDGKTFSHQVKASDPDDDQLSYQLKDAPEGMTISNAGLILWTVPLGFSGNVSATVIVADSNGGTASNNLLFQILKR
ncbi:MAG: Ig-like domain-containing protein [Porphyromonadaceae bacterium]|nr:Ig-like domain-containing protein [Porphyromonadaceae bacterium]